MTVAGWILLCLALLAQTPGTQQTPSRDMAVAGGATGTAVLSGIVVNDRTGQPVRRAIVALRDTEHHLGMSIVTDDRGTFSFKDLPAGRVFLGAARPGYVSTSYGAKRPGRPGTTIALADGQQKTGVTLRLLPGAVIAGAVYNQAGEPLPGVRVVVLQPSFGYDTGERTLSPVAGGFGESTDDRGAYRIFGLPPGDYFVVVTPGIGINRSAAMREVTAAEMDWAARQLRGGAPLTPPPEPGRAVDYVPVFYPGVYNQASASPVTVKVGEERAGVDVVLALTPAAKITGTVTSTDGALPPNLQVNVVAHDTIPGVPFSGFGTARVDAEGRFVSAGLSPGDYTITVRAGAGGGRSGPAGAGAAARFGMTTVTINGRDVTTTIPLESGVSVSGQLVFDGTTLKPPPDLTKVRVSLTPVRSGTPTLGVPATSADATGAFGFVGVAPGRYRLSAFGAGAWQIRSATVQGRDAIDVPFDVQGQDVSGAEVTFTDRPSELSGVLLDADGRPAPEYFVITFPSDRTRWLPQSRRIQSVRPATDGHFRVQNLPAGEYWIAAAADVETGEWYDPSFLAQLVATATKVTLAEGEKKIQDLKLAPAAVAKIFW